MGQQPRKHYWRWQPVVVLAGVALSLGLTITLTPPVWAALPATAQKQLDGAVFNYNRGYIQKAIPAFQQILKEHPDSQVTRLWLAKALMKQGGDPNFEQARGLLRQITTEAPQEGEAWALLGDITRWNPETRWESIQALQNALKLAPQFPEVQKKQAALTRSLVEELTWEGKFNEALPYAQGVFDALKGDRSWLVTYADILSHVGQAGAAITLFDTDIRPTDDDPVQWQLTYLSALKQSGQIETAKTRYAGVEEKALAKTQPELLSSLSAIAYDLGLYQRSDLVDEWLPPDWQRRREVMLRRARTLAKLDRAPEAIDQFQNVYQQGDMTPWEKLEYGDYLLDLRLPASALPEPNLIAQLYQQALAQKPELNSAVYLRLARLYKRQATGDQAGFLKAVQAYSQAMTTADPATQEQIEPEFLAFVQSNQSDPAAAEAVFETLQATYPNDHNITGAYAEFLSWQPAKRKQAANLYLNLWQSGGPYAEPWADKLAETLSWHSPSPDWLSLYETILKNNPNANLEKQALISKAKALSADPDHYAQAVDLMNQLKTQYPDDTRVAREWLNILMVTDADSKKAKAGLKALVSENPNDVEAQLALGRVLSQRAQHRQAAQIFDDILTQHPDNKEALVGKGYALLWGGQPFKAQQLLEDAHAQYPEDTAIGLALASTYKQIGRSDKAIELLQQIRPLLNYQFDFDPAWRDPRLAWIPCDYLETAPTPTVSYDFQAPLPSMAKVPSPEVSVWPEEAVSTDDPLTPALSAQQQRRLIEEVYALSNSLNALNGKPTVQPDTTALLNTSTSDLLQTQPAFGQSWAQQIQSGSTVQSQDSYLTDNFNRLEDNLFLDMRPEFKMGFFYQTQAGERTTNRMNVWGLPNQAEIALTPQVRVRGGAVPSRYYLPDAPTRPHSNFGWLYTLGASYQPTDKLKLDGDIGLTHFTQSGKENLTYRAQADYSFNDHFKLSLGARRAPFNNSLLSIAGFQPSAGAYRGQVLGPVNENDFYGYLTFFPIPSIDITGGYEWAFVTSTDSIPTNFKNQFYGGAGYTHRFNNTHSLRLGYEFLYFGFSKNATNGYFDVESGVRRPLASLRPVGPADSGYVFGGYFSPDWFVLNAIRLDYRGSLFKNFLEWKIGGSIGIQNFEHGFGIQDSDPQSLATAFNVALTANLTKSIAAYGRTNFMDSGGLFQRWRFEAGLILRPTIESLMPLLGERVDPSDKINGRPKQEFDPTEHDRQDVKFYN